MVNDTTTRPKQSNDHENSIIKLAYSYYYNNIRSDDTILEYLCYPR